MRNILNKYKQTLSRPCKRTDFPAIIFTGLIIFGLFFTVFMLRQDTNIRSNAQSVNTVEAENGMLSGNVTIVSDTNASEEKYVKFGNVATPTPASVSYTGSTIISGITNLTADVSGLTQPPRIVAVTWKLGNTSVGTDTTSPYSFDANAALLPSGNQTMTVEAVDENGTRTTSPGVAVTVDSAPTATSTTPSASNAIVHLTGSSSGFTVGAGTRVYGDGPNTIVNGNVTLSDGSRLENLKVNGSIVPASNSRVQGVTLTPSGDGMAVNGRVEFSVQDSTLNGPSATGSNKGIYAFNDDTAHDISVIRSVVRNFGGDGIAMYGYAAGSHARDVLLDNTVSDATGPYANGTQARDILLGGDQAVIIGNHCDGATTDNIQTFGGGTRMRINHNSVTNSGVGFYLEHFTDDSIFADNVVGTGVGTGFNVEWLAGGTRTSKNVKFIRNDITYTSSGIFADAGTTGMEVGPGNIFRGGLPAVTYQGSTQGSIHDNTACTIGTGNFANVYANAGFDPTGNVTQSNNVIRTPGNCPAVLTP